MLGQMPSSEFLVRPYLQLGSNPQKGLAIVWHTRDTDAPFEAAAFVNGKRWTVVPTSRRIAVSGLPPHRILVAEFPDLPSGSRFQYAIRQRGNLVFRAEGIARPAGDRFRVAIVGDTGENSRGQREVAFQMWRARPELLVHTGDIVYPHGRMTEYRSKWFPIMNAPVPGSRSGAPLLQQIISAGVPGNHDTAYRNLRRYPDGLAYYPYWIQPLNYRPGLPLPRLTAMSGVNGGNFAFRTGPVFWVMLDANTYINWRSQTARQWLDSALAAAGDATWRFVVWHQPGFHSSDKKSDEIYMRSVSDLLTKHRVQVVWNGHVHNYQRTYPIIGEAGGKFRAETSWRSGQPTRGTIHVVTGSGGAPLYDQSIARNRARWQPFTAQYTAGYGFTQLDLEGGSATVRQIGNRGQVLDEFQIVK